MFTALKDGSLELVSSVLAFFYSLPVVGGSYGIAIMLLTGTVMVVLMPLTIRATRSQIKMMQLQPEMRALQKKHKEDRQQLNTEMMALYQQHGVNPVGGCIPMLAQLPVFLLLFNVLRGLTRRVSDKPYFTVADEAHQLTGASTGATDTFDPEHLDQSSLLYQDLSEATEMNFLGVFDLSLNPWDVVQSNFLAGIPYVILILFVVATSYFQQRQISARRGTQPDNPTPQQQTQQQLLRILPFMSGIWSFLFPAGLVLYWATSNVFRIGQQAYITQALYKGEDAPGVKLAEIQEAEAKKADDDDDVDDDASELIGDGRPSRGSKNGGSKNAKNGSKGSGSKDGSGRSGSKGGSKKNAGSSDGSADRNGGGTAVDRNEAWENRRAQRASAQQRKSKNGGTSSSSRTTPKGTKPSESQRRRKNKK